MAQPLRVHIVLVDTNKIKITQSELLFAWFCKLGQVSEVRYNCFTATSCIFHATCLKDGSGLKRGTRYKSSTRKCGVPGASFLDFSRYGMNYV